MGVRIKNQIFSNNWYKEKLQNPRLSAVWIDYLSDDETIILSGKERIFYADAFQIGFNSWVLKSTISFDLKINSCIKIYIRMETGWRPYLVRIVYINSDFIKTYFFHMQVEMPLESKSQEPFRYSNFFTKLGPLFSDYEFFCTIPFLKAISRDAVCPLLNNIVFKFVKAGKKIIKKGKVGKTCYIIQKGLCQVIIEKDGTQKILDKIGPKEFVGEMALLTGDVRVADVVAETDIHLWVINSTVRSFAAIRRPVASSIADCRGSLT